MNKTPLTLTVVITSIAVATSIYLATVEDPTEIQKQLSSTTNTIALTGTTTIFSLWNDDEDNPGDS